MPPKGSDLIFDHRHNAAYRAALRGAGCYQSVLRTSLRGHSSLRTRESIWPDKLLTRAQWHGGPVEFDRIVPPSGNLWVAGRQFWLGPARAGTVIRFWADCQLIHLSAGGARIKTLRSHLSVNDLARLAANGGVPAGPSPLPPIEDGQAVEVDRPVSRGGLVSCGPPPAARRRDPRRAAGRHPHRTRHPDVLRLRKPGTAAHPAQPAHLSRSGPAARRPPCRRHVLPPSPSGSSAGSAPPV